MLLSRIRYYRPRDFHFGCWHAILLCLGSFILGEARCHVVSSTMKRPTGQGPRPLPTANIKLRTLSTALVKLSKYWGPQLPLRAWLQPCKRSLARTTQLNHFYISDSWKVYEIINVCCLYLLNFGGNLLCSNGWLTQKAERAMDTSNLKKLKFRGQALLRKGREGRYLLWLSMIILLN